MPLFARVPLAFLLAAAIQHFPDPALAQDFPTKPIRFIVANTPGSSPDTVARILAPEMSKALGQPIIVENKPGAGQIIGYEYVAKQVPADGYTAAIVVVTQLATLPVLAKELRFDPTKDLQPVMGIAEGRYLFGSASRLPWKTFRELVAHAKANPGKLNYGSPSALARLTMEAFLRDLGVSVVHIPYSSTGPFYAALAAGDVQMGLVGEAQVISFGEKFRVLAVTGEQRHTAHREAPTFSELGHPKIPGFSYSLNVPLGTPRPIIDKMYAVGSRVLKLAEVRAGFAKLKLEIAEQAPDLASRTLAEQARLFGEIAKKIGLQPE